MTRARDDHQAGHPTVEAEAATSRADVGLVFAVVLAALAAAQAPSAPPRPVHRDREADLEAGDTVAHCFDPPRVLVPEGERRVPRERPLGEVVHEVQVGVAGAGPADPDEHLARSRVGVGNVVELGQFAELEELERAHDPMVAERDLRDQGRRSHGAPGLPALLVSLPVRDPATVSASVISGAEALPGSIARRALELAHDRALSLGDAVQHLVRLADARSAPLERALADLRGSEPPGSELDYACILLRSSIGAVAAPPFFGGSAPAPVMA